jgi:gamma-glutamylcyclotransferase (GGCT)/AIG2-like uncharacterized protein YtfP
MDSFEPHNLLFVYGELMRGMERERFLSKDKAKFLSSATTAGILCAIGDFPALIIDSAIINSTQNGAASNLPQMLLAPEQFSNEREVRGELFEIFDPITFFGTLDVIEGYWPDQAERSLFARQVITVITEQGETKAWAYVLTLPLNGLSQFDPDL